jgi:hypothetical protein
LNDLPALKNIAAATRTASLDIVAAKGATYVRVRIDFDHPE